MASASSDIDVALEELEARLERLRALYEQYFIGIEKLEPSVPRQDVDRRIYALRKIQIRNTAKRFKLQTIIQRYNAFQQYWLRICREIENGTYHRHVARAQSRFGDVPLTAAARRRARLQGPQNQTDEQKAATAEKAKARKEADDDLEALLGEDLDAALSRALVAADHVEITRVAPATSSMPVEGAPVPTAEAAPSKAPGVAPPRPEIVAPIEAAAPAKSLAPRPPPRTKPTAGATAEAAAAASSPAVAASDPAPTIPLKPAAGESPAAAARAKGPALPPARRAPAKAEVPSANPPARDAPVPARPGPGVPAPVAAARAGTPPTPGATAQARAGATAAVPVVARVPAPAGAAAGPAQAAGAAQAPPAPPVEQPARKGTGAGAPAAAAPPVATGPKPARAKEAASPKTKPATAAAKAVDGWAALRPPTAEREARTLQPAKVAEVASASNPVQTNKASVSATRPAAKAPPKAEPARADAKPQAQATPAAPPVPTQTAPITVAAEPKKVQPKPAPADVPPHAPGPRVATASPRADAEPEAPGPSAEQRAAAGRAAAARAAEIRSQAQAAPPGAGMDDQRLSQLHGALVAERRRLNQPGKVSKDALAASLRDTESKLRKQYGDKQIDFHVVVKDGKAVVKPIVG